MTRRRIVQVFSALDPGGAELRTLELLEQISSVDYEVIFVLLSGRRGSVAHRAEGLGAEVVPLRLDARFPLRFVRFLRARRVDIVHSHVATFSGFVQLLARLGGVRTRISHLRSDHDGRPDSLRRRVQRRVARGLLLRCSTAVVGVTPAALDFATGGRPTRGVTTAVVPNGLRLHDLPDPDRRPEIRRARGLLGEELLVLNVGRASPAKNRERAVDIGLLAARAGMVTAVVGDLEPQLRARIRARSAPSAGGGRVEAWGFLDPVEEALLAADVLLVTSVREGLPGVVLQALAVGTPVLSSPLTGVDYITEQLGLGTWTLSLDDSDERWVEQLAVLGRLHRDPLRRAALRAAFTGSPFTVERSAHRIRQLWDGASGG